MMKKDIERRDFIKWAAAGSTALAAATWWPRCRPQVQRPNILFCISDDQSYPHTSAYGCTFVKTPAFDRIAKEGILFQNTFVSTPSCCPSRGSLLSGQDFYRLREASMNHTIWPGGIDVYPDILAEAGYHTGYTGKGWAPGDWQVSGRDHNPAGPVYNQIKTTPPTRYMSPVDYAENFKAFIKNKPAEAPFCFWFGAIEPHREYEEGSGIKAGLDPDNVQVPSFYPDAAAVRSDLLDYALEIAYYDGHLNKMMQVLEEIGELDNTLIVITSDNGMPFPRAKATLYEYGAHVPMAIRWGDRMASGRVVDDFVSFTDLAPTFLQAAGLDIPQTMTGHTLMPILTATESGQIETRRDYAVFGIERHFPGSRPDGAGYPMRAIRTKEFLYIHNLTPEANPSGDHPGPVWPGNDDVGGYGDTDGGATKSHIWGLREQHPEYAAWAFGKRPQEELYHINDDPDCLINLATDPSYLTVKNDLAARLQNHLMKTQDPRAMGKGAMLDEIMRRFPRTKSER